MRQLLSTIDYKLLTVKKIMQPCQLFIYLMPKKIMLVYF